MPMKQSYMALEGQVLYQMASGHRTSYLHDASGSVIATTDSSGTVLNTYRWAAYGAPVAKTGSSSDPKYGWTGALGLRQTGRVHADEYANLKHYGTPEGRLTNPYRVGRSRLDGRFALSSRKTLSKPYCYVDPGDEVGYSQLEPWISLETCGGWGGVHQYLIEWDEDGLPEGRTGFIIQEIRDRRNYVSECCGKRGPCPPRYHYWEMWYWNGATIGYGYEGAPPYSDLPYDDGWARSACPRTTGHHTVEGWAKFVRLAHECKDTLHWAPGSPGSGRGHLLGTQMKPPGWTRNHTTYRWEEAFWECCKDEWVVYPPPICAAICLPESLNVTTRLNGSGRDDGGNP